MKYNLIDYPQYDFFTYYMFYNYLTNKFKDGETFVEIGSWLGRSAIYIAEKVKIKKLNNFKFYTVDIFDNNEITDNSFDYNTLEIMRENKLYESFLENIEPYKDYIISIKGDSKKVYEQFENESIDYIFLDGDHSLEGFSQDIKLWYPKVKTGGVVSGHDYIWGGKGVKSIIDNFSTFKAKQFGFGDVWFYTK